MSAATARKDCFRDASARFSSLRAVAKQSSRKPSLDCFVAPLLAMTTQKILLAARCVRALPTTKHHEDSPPGSSRGRRSAERRKVFGPRSTGKCRHLPMPRARKRATDNPLIRIIRCGARSPSGALPRLCLLAGLPPSGVKLRATLPGTAPVRGAGHGPHPPVQRAPRRPVFNAGPGGVRVARERGANPRAGTASRSAFESALAKASLDERDADL